MDFGGTISRAIKITWEHKVLWILGFLAALGSGGGGGGGVNYNMNQPVGGNFANGNVPPWMQQLMQHPERIYAGVAVITCLLVIIGVIFAIISIIARGGLIAGVQQVETENKTTFGGAWKVGASRFWSLLGLNLLLAIPIIILVVILVIVFAASFGGIIAASIASNGRFSNDRDVAGMMGVLIGGISVFCCLLCVTVIFGLLVEAISTFGERAIVIENRGVTASISQAWAIFRANLGNIILLALLMGFIGAIFGLVTGAIALAIILPTLVPVIIEVARGGTPGAGAIVVAIIGVIVASILGAIVRALYVTFNSATWTLAFRQFTGAAPVVAPPTAIQPPLPAA